MANAEARAYVSAMRLFLIDEPSPLATLATYALLKAELVKGAEGRSRPARVSPKSKFSNDNLQSDATIERVGGGGSRPRGVERPPPGQAPPRPSGRVVPGAHADKRPVRAPAI
jgi:hypothetical protein